jgi:hypothetical protein
VNDGLFSSMSENQTTALTLVATDNNVITYGISSGDSTDFSLNANTGVITFRTAPDYEAETNYSFTATATDSLGNEITQEVTITISDVQEHLYKGSGQTHSYAPHDDGFYQGGWSASYTRNSSTKVVLDHGTGLEWQDNSAVEQNRPQADAVSYCASLSLDGGGWRLPTARELLYIIDYSKQRNALNVVFQYPRILNDTYDNWYYFWTSTELDPMVPAPFGGSTRQNRKRWIGFDKGRSSYEGGDATRDARCVRGELVPASPFAYRDYSKSGNIVEDHWTNLEWQDNEEASKRTWTNAIAYCEALTLGGKSDWRLPTINELESIVDYDKDRPAIADEFTTMISGHSEWSSTTYANNTSLVWVLKPKFGTITDRRKSEKQYTHCVRTAG